MGTGVGKGQERLSLQQLDCGLAPDKVFPL